MRLFLALALAVVASSSYAAQPLSRTVEKWQDMRASELIGTTAVDRQGEHLGRIKDLILSTQTGHVHYVVVTFGGWKPVNDEKGDRTGELEDIVVNLGTGELRYVVVELQRPRRLADSRVALPLHALAVPILPGEPLRLRSDRG